MTAAYQTAKDDLEGQRSFAGWVSNIFAGISLSSILLLMALGLAITFGLMGVINMAHGEMLMIGCVTTGLVMSLSAHSYHHGSTGSMS